MKKAVMMMLITSQVVLAQDKFELRVSAGNNTFIKAPFIEYPNENQKFKVSPLVNVSFYINATKKTLLGIEVQHEWLNKKSQTGNVTDAQGASLRPAYSVQKKNIASFGVGGRTYFVSKLLYAGYGYRFAVTNTNTNELNGFVTRTITYQQETYHVPNFSIGLKFTEKYILSPFIEINPAFYIGSKDTYYGIQAKAGIVF